MTSHVRVSHRLTLIWYVAYFTRTLWLIKLSRASIKRGFTPHDLLAWLFSNYFS